MGETRFEKPEWNKNDGETRLDFQGTAWTNCWKNRWGVNITRWKPIRRNPEHLQIPWWNFCSPTFFRIVLGLDLESMMFFCFYALWCFWGAGAGGGFKAFCFFSFWNLGKIPRHFWRRYEFQLGWLVKTTESRCWNKYFNYFPLDT